MQKKTILRQAKAAISASADFNAGARAPEKRGKRRNLILLSSAELLVMTLWFSASAMVPQLTTEWNLNSWQRSWITMGVQLGFVVGAITSAMLNLADRMPGRILIGLSAILGAAFNAFIPLSGAGISVAIGLRFLTGFVLAGVYPPGMKMVATWCKVDRGLGIGVLVGALTIGSAAPHLITGLTMMTGGSIMPWQTVMLVTSGLSALAGFVILVSFRPGPYLSEAAPFNWKYTGQVFSSKPTVLANMGYLGHMWELYAMWTWVPLFLIESYSKSGLNPQFARVVQIYFSI